MSSTRTTDPAGTDATLHTLPRVRDEATGRLKRKRSTCETFERNIRAMERTPASFFRDEKAARAAARRLDAVAKRWLRGYGALGAKAVASDPASSESGELMSGVEAIARGVA